MSKIPVDFHTTTLAPSLLAGQYVVTSFNTYTPWVLWKQFRPLVPAIPHRVDDSLVALHRYPEGLDLTQVGADEHFEQWALVEVTQAEGLPEMVKPLHLEGGDYAVFEHSGTMEDFQAAMQWLITHGLPRQQLALDARPYFEVMDHRYKGPADPSSVETVYVPVKAMI